MNILLDIIINKRLYLPFRTAPSPLVNFVNGLRTPFSIIAAVSTAPSSKTCPVLSRFFCRDPPLRTCRSPVVGSNSTTPRNLLATFFRPPEATEAGVVWVLPDLTSSEDRLIFLALVNLRLEKLRLCGFRQWQKGLAVSKSKKCKFKVHTFWEGRKILRNLHDRFVHYYIGQIYDGDFAKFCGLLRIYEL